MTNDDIIRMARRAADYWANHYDRKSKADMELLSKHVAEKFIEIAAAEREACANVCDSYDVADDVCSSDTAEGIAIAIRARGQHD
jgi:hypothetical protein